MTCITGLFLIHAPASALNMRQAEDNEAQVKRIRARDGDYAYVSAQSYKYWLRTTLTQHFADTWQASPVYYEEKKKQQGYTAGDPITYADDDLFGYMRAIKSDTLTRVAPFRMGTLVSLAPVNIVSDFGVMVRERQIEGTVLHSHQFYRADLKGVFSIDLTSVGTFTSHQRSGFRNLNEDLLQQAKMEGFTEIGQGTYQMPITERIHRTQTLLRAMARVEGGAHQSRHYTDVTPAFVILAVTQGGNHIFNHVVRANRYGKPTISIEGLTQIKEALAEDLRSPIYIGVVAGYMDEALAPLADFGLSIQHPRQAFDQLADDIAHHPEWFA